MQIKAESAARALADAGLTWKDVDAIYDAGEGGGMSGLTIAEYFGLKAERHRYHRRRRQLIRVPRGARQARHRRRQGARRAADVRLDGAQST